jgi:glucosamine kinase
MRYLGIDGGGTGCRAAVADAAGRVLGRGAADSANVWSDPEGARASVLAAAEAAVADAGGGELGALCAALGLAGANVPEAVARLGPLPFARVRIESDAAIALKGALGDGDGVMAALGTGSVFGVQRAGAIRMIGGWGFVLGDQGSGARMGRELLEAALLAHDGLAASTPLLAGVLAEFGEPATVVAFARSARPAEFARYAPRILAAEAAGDPAAVAIVGEAESWVVRAVERLMADGPLPVCFLGGLGEVFAARLAGRLPGPVRPPLGTALDGALLMARGLG